jgi:penicillin-binding protein 1C
MRCGRGVGAAVIAAVGLAALVADRIFPLDLSRYQVRSLEVLDAAGETLHVSTTRDGIWRLGGEADSVDPRYLAMLFATEDRRFWWHPGVDPLALVRAVWQLATRGRVVSGGSTLTMQVARLLAPHRHDVAGKLLDVARAFQLEAHYTKRQILSMYLTLAPFGGNIEGVRAASLIYFGSEPNHLTDGQAALLVALPRSPTSLRPDRHPDRAAAAERHVLLRVKPEANPEELAATERRPLKTEVPHFADRLQAIGLVGRVQTTLESGLQRSVEDLVRRERPWLGDKANIAVLVVRNGDRAVLAYVGGADYLGPTGMVDMVRAERSPGSTLKPFIYGLAFDDALITPDTLIEDAPIRVGEYAPQNFDRDFHGTGSAREALQQSYNLPAVELLSQVGPSRFAATLRQAGAKLKLPRGALEPSLPVALGGVGIDLEDLTMLYVGLANNGRAAKLRYFHSEPQLSTASLMTDEAAWNVGDILRGTPLPDGVSMSRPRAIAYKTGTSYGFRDAWSVGYSPAYTVGVWVGRVEGSPRPGAFGRNTAAPLLFKLFDILPPEPEGSPPRPHPAASELPVRLAPSLKRYTPRGAMFMAAEAPGPRIIFPPSGATLEFGGPSGSAPPIALEAVGGAPPYRWAVNGTPLPLPSAGTTLTWLPDGPGFARISVSDRNNRTATEAIRLQ